MCIAICNIIEIPFLCYKHQQYGGRYTTTSTELTLTCGTDNCGATAAVSILLHPYRKTRNSMS
jgi:hypothetical protein